MTLSVLKALLVCRREKYTYILARKFDLFPTQIVGRPGKPPIFGCDEQNANLMRPPETECYSAFPGRVYAPNPHTN